MKDQRNAVKAGLFILVSIVLIIVLIVAIKGASRIFQPVQIRTAEFTLADDLGGLNVGDDVRIGGFRVGVVRSIDLEQARDDDAQAKIKVVFSIPGKYKLREGANLSIQGTLTGMSWLNFDNLGQGAELSANAMLVGHPSTMTVITSSLSAVVPQVTATINDIHSVTVPRINQMATTFDQAGSSAQSLVEDVRTSWPEMLERYEKVADRTAEMMVELRDILGDTKGDIRGVMANLNHATGDLKDKLPQVLDKFNLALDGINAAMDDLQATIANTHDLSDSAKQIVAANRGRIDAMIRSLKTMADNLRSASSEIRRSPWRLLYKPQPGEMANLNLFDAAREFAEGARALEDATSALTAATQDPSVNEGQLRELLEQVKLRADQYHQLEQKLWDAVKP